MKLTSTLKPIECLLKIQAAGLFRWLCCACVRAWLREEEKQLLFRISGHLLPCDHLLITINTPTLFASKWIHTIPPIAQSLLSATFLSEPKWVCKVILLMCPQLPTKPNRNLFSTFFEEGNQNDPVDYPFWRTRRRNQTVLSGISVGGFFVVSFWDLFFPAGCLQFPPKAWHMCFTTHSCCALACKDIRGGSPAWWKSVGRKLIPQEISAKWHLGSWSPIRWKISLHWWFWSSLLCHNSTQGLLLLFSRIVLPVINSETKLGAIKWGNYKAGGGETTRLVVEKLIPFAFQTFHLTAVLEKLSHRTALACEIPKGYDKSNK